MKKRIEGVTVYGIDIGKNTFTSSPRHFGQAAFVQQSEIA